MLEHRIGIRKTKFLKPDGRKDISSMNWMKVRFKFARQYSTMAASYARLRGSGAPGAPGAPKTTHLQGSPICSMIFELMLTGRRSWSN